MKFTTIKSDIPASLVVFLVALPLCMGIALGSGAPVISGLIAGIIGGVVVGYLSGSSLSVSGPAAGLIATVSAGIVNIGSFEAFLVSVIIAGFFFSLQLFAQDTTKGAELYKQCIACHGEKGEGNPSQKAPRLSGQYDWYLLKQLKEIKAGVVRKNPVMMPFLNKLTEQDMIDLSAYISKLSE